MYADMVKTNPSLVIDVTPVGPGDLRRRLVSEVSATMLPGGMLLEETDGCASYQLPAEGGWTPVQIAGEWHFSHQAGHVVVLNDGGVTVTTAQ